ncbi:LOW QUALITY PROTEIN: hypothetical protein HID58_011014 [Brassica napus]|uniref:Large ribosomal subunit protein bL12 C-terminal domain-containing protein n=1 Tax=Brassica napus TaxID=3708 RepID=A0ABQ8DWX9_BRANA|nr:LOW QUALITY PROTEIN: hypothetical protein HID58_011014 [Brassica napus]
MLHFLQKKNWDLKPMVHLALTRTTRCNHHADYFDEVGIYGYAAYSASKFGLKSLQQEVIADDIHVTLVFPPDTDTPGFEEEQKSRPEVTIIIAASSGKLWMESRQESSVSCNFGGFLLSLATTGMSPQRSFWIAFLEIITAGPIRLVAHFFQWICHCAALSLSCSDASKIATTSGGSPAGSISFMESAAGCSSSSRVVFNLVMKKLISLVKNVHSRQCQVNWSVQVRFLQKDSVSKPKRYKYPSLYDPYGSRPQPSSKIMELSERIASLYPKERKQISPALNEHLRLPKDDFDARDDEFGSETRSWKLKSRGEEGEDGIKVIKEGRAFTSLGLKEAKELVEKVPVVIKQGLTKEEANGIIEKIKAVGGVADIE